MARFKLGDWVRVATENNEGQDTLGLIVETFEHEGHIEELNEYIVELSNIGRKQLSGFQVEAVRQTEITYE